MSPLLSHSETRLTALNAPANASLHRLTRGRHPLIRSGKIQPESVVANVAVWATSQRTDPKAKALGHQSVDPVDRRHATAPKLSTADVAYLPSRCLQRQDPTATCLAEIAEIAEISKSSMKWASERRRDFLPLIAQIARNTFRALTRAKDVGAPSQNRRNCPNRLGSSPTLRKARRRSLRAGWPW
jgi:hypothetical protein